MLNAEYREVGLWQRLTGIITRPGAILEAVVEKPTIWGPAGVISLFNLLLFMATVPKLQEYMLQSLEKMPQNLPPEQIAQMKSFAGMGAVIGGGLVTIIGPFVVWLIAVLLFKFFNLFIGGEAPFKKLYAVAVITSVPTVLANILRTILVAASPAESFASITTSAALVLPKGSLGPAYAVLSQIDPFYIWSLVLLAMGAAQVLKTSVRKTGTFVLILWLVIAGIGALVASLKSGQVPGV